MADARIRDALIIWKTTTPDLSPDEIQLIDWLIEQAGQDQFAAARDYAILSCAHILRMAIVKARHHGVLRRWP